MPIPGLPFVSGVPGSGGSSEHPERLITGLDYKYDRALWPRMVGAHLDRGYTHWLRWWPNARDDGGNSISQFVDDCLYLKSLGMPYIIVNLGSKVFDPRDQSLREWQARVDLVIDQLTMHRAVDELIPAFEMDSFNIPGGPTIQYSKWVGQKAHAAGVSCWLHFFPEHTSWFADGDSRGRFGFWDDLGADVDGLCYQSMGLAWDVPFLQAKIVDTLSQFGRQGNIHKFRLMEDLASAQFSGVPTGSDFPNEDHAALRAFLACCTVDNVSHTDAKVWGYGGGGAKLDGTRL